jgi:hypothetical protein
MNSKFLIFGILILMFSFSVSALEWTVCIDKQAPLVPTGLDVTSSYVFSWNEAGDSPESTEDCIFGISYYRVYVDGEYKGKTSSLSYPLDALADGSYEIGVEAVDKAGNVGERATESFTFPIISSGGNNNNEGGGSSSSSSGSKSSNGVSTKSSGVDSGDDLLGDSVLNDSEPVAINFEGDSAGVTGGVIGVLGSAGGIVSIIFVLIVVVGYAAIRVKRRGK